MPSQVLYLAGIAVLTHPILDTLNTYGVRWLMPFSGRWYYGDTLFIVDPWLWLILGVGYVLSGERRRSRRFSGWAARPASAALMIASVYIVVMAGLGLVARKIVTRELRSVTGEEIEALMVGPAPLTPLVRNVVAAQRTSYRLAEFRWLRRPHVDVASLRSYPRARPHDAAVDAAVGTPLGRRFLSWARFPVIEVERHTDGSAQVHLIDLRYADRPGAGFGTVTIPVPARTAAESSSEILAPYPPTESAAPSSR